MEFDKEVMELDISSIEGRLSVTLLDDILASFLARHNSCESNKQLLDVVDRYALDFRIVCEMGVTTLEKASSNWCENYILWSDNVGDASEPALRDEMKKSSEEFSTAFGTIGKCCQNFASLFLGSRLIKMSEEEEQITKKKLNEAERANEEAKEAKEAERAKDEAERTCLSRFSRSTSRDDIKRAADQKARMTRIKDYKYAKNKFDEASLFLHDVKVLNDNVKKFMEIIIDLSKELEKFLKVNYQYFEELQSGSRSLPSKITADKNSESIMKLKEEWDSYYKDMLISTSKRNFIPSNSVPRSELTPVNILEAQYTF